MEPIPIPGAPGELLDKIAILRLKTERLGRPEQRANAARELALLEALAAARLPDSDALRRLSRDLEAVNGELWEIEDAIRECERAGDFGDGFVDLARRVYRRNDRRAALKREVNLLLDSEIVEEKSYAAY